VPEVEKHPDAHRSKTGEAFKARRSFFVPNIPFRGLLVLISKPEIILRAFVPSLRLQRETSTFLAGGAKRKLKAQRTDS
jgi:hypothetical protein